MDSRGSVRLMEEEYLRWACVEPRSQEDRLPEPELVDALIPLPRTPLD